MGAKRLTSWTPCPHLFVQSQRDNDAAAERAHSCELCGDATIDTPAANELTQKCVSAYNGAIGAWGGRDAANASAQSVAALRSAWDIPSDDEQRLPKESFFEAKMISRMLRNAWRHVGRREAGSLGQLMRLIVRDRAVVRCLTALHDEELRALMQPSGGAEVVETWAEALSYEEALLARFALRYSGASFGVPYERGCFESVEAVARMQASRDEDIKNPRNREQLFSIARMLHQPRFVEHNPLRKLVMGRFAVTPNLPTFFVACEHWCKTIVVAFRGTTSDGDVVTDLECTNVPFYDGIAHSGFANAVVAPGSVKGAPEIGNSFAAALEATLRDLVSKHPQYDVVVTGHSLGASWAALFGVHAYKSGIVPLERLAVVTFGCPPCGTESLCAALERDGLHDRLLSVVHSYDCVPRLSVRNVSRLLAAKPKALRSLEDLKSCGKSEAPELLVPGRVVLLQRESGIPSAVTSSGSGGGGSSGLHHKYMLSVDAARHIPISRHSPLLAAPIPSVRAVRDHLLPPHARLLHDAITSHRLHDLHRGTYAKEVRASVVGDTVLS